MRRTLLLLVLASLVATPAAAWEWTPTDDGTLPTCWVERSHPVLLGETGSDDISFAQAEHALEQALETWSSPACSDWDFDYRGTTSDTRAGFDSEDIEGNTNVVVWNEDDFTYGVFAALTLVTFDPTDGRIYDVDIEMNGTDYTFSVDGEAGVFDVQDVLTHELGHFIGLGHSTVGEATMAGGSVPGETFRHDLDPDDIDGLCTIYPAGDVTPDCPAGAGPVDDEWGQNDCSCASAPSGAASLISLVFGVALVGRRRRATSAA
jgi:hypothetical protein